MATTCDLTCCTEWLFLVLWWISMPLYALFLFTLVRYIRTSLHEPYWTLCISQGIADMLNLTQWYLFFKLPSWGHYPAFFLTNQYFWGPIAMLPLHMFHLASHIGVVILSVNRFTAIVYPLEHKSFWSPRTLFIAISLQWILSVLMISPEIPMRIGWTWTNDSLYSGAISPLVAPDDMPRFLLVSDIIFFFFSGVRIPIYLALYGSMVVSYMRSKNRHAKVSQAPAKRQSRQTSNMNVRKETSSKAPKRVPQNVEMKLALASVVLIVCDFCWFLNFLHLKLNPSVAQDWKSFNMRASVSEDVFGWSNPWLLLIFSRKLRQHMIAVVRCKTAENL